MAPAAGFVRARLTIAYDGTDFRGFARNEGVVTVEGVLTNALEQVLGHEVTLACAGRTDAGVHAWGQVVSFDAEQSSLDLEKLAHAVTAMLGPAVVVRDAQVAPDDFDARHSARWRAYRYTIINRPVPDPFLARTAWWVPQPLDLRAMILGCDPLIGEHDFTSFCRKPQPGPSGEERSMVRRVLDASWKQLEGDVLRFDVRATAFCHQMVRSLVGTLVEVGSLRKSAGTISGILRAKDRHAAGNPAPPHGLCLWEVGY